MDVLNGIKELAKDIGKSFPEATTELTSFASGAVMLDVRLRGRVIVMAYSPASGFGVDELKDGEGFDTGYRFISGDLDSAAAELRRLIRNDTASSK
jgi:hypothetical protein